MQSELFKDRFNHAKHWANQHRSRVERRARVASGHFLVNLTHEWRLLLVREVLS
ncbi:hypothetical protein [Thiothrix fructosivorans]|uniref:Transposase n=1 Tax=Thiothrix fructosivorans TaxID=111770 RepID=A0A8B0SJW0_9GAMM|nr:hypothetical protein [Thiothrix fructosivorans]MBO0615274.1 hypothetical protein [Thiothrix fructosivorans]QTX10057.1 hypothetical protein J1836_015850 [Thiothrix fructosivorans]